MPNWCDNNLTVSGSSADVEKFVEENSRTETAPNGETTSIPLSFDLAVPTPTNEDGSLRDDWYDWRVANWGTKWDLDDETQTDIQDGFIIYRFMTAWAPPLSWLDKVAEKYPSLTFVIQYEEGGMGFAGSAEYSGGEQVESSEWEIEYNEETEEYEPV